MSCGSKDPNYDLDNVVRTFRFVFYEPEGPDYEIIFGRNILLQVLLSKWLCGSEDPNYKNIFDYYFLSLRLKSANDFVNVFYLVSGKIIFYPFDHIQRSMGIDKICHADLHRFSSQN